MIKLIIIIIIILIFFYHLIKKIKLELFIQILLKIFNLKIKIINRKYLSNVNDRIILMGNHYSACDMGIINHIIHTVSNKKIYSVAKHNIFGDKNDMSTISNFVSLFKGMYEYLNLIPYEKGNKESGEQVKNKMLEVVNNNDTVLIFPEGTTSRKGIPTEFKPGSFKLCAENKIKILPITLEYNKRIGMNTDDQFNILDWFNSTVTVTLHPPIYNEDSEILKKDVYDAITKQLINKYIKKNLINLV